MDESFVPATQQTSVLYWRLSDLKTELCKAWNRICQDFLKVFRDRWFRTDYIAMLWVVVLPFPDGNCFVNRQELFEKKSLSTVAGCQTMGGFICTFSILISLSITLRSSKFRNQFTISSKYFHMACYLKWEDYSGLISFEVHWNDIWTAYNIQSFEMPF